MEFTLADGTPIERGAPSADLQSAAKQPHHQSCSQENDGALPGAVTLETRFHAQSVDPGNLANADGVVPLAWIAMRQGDERAKVLKAAVLILTRH